MPDQERARMELEADAWHQNDEGNYYVDCPECGSAATLPNILAHGRCNGYLDEKQGDTELDETAMSCTAELSLELTYGSSEEASGADEAVGDED